MLGCILIIKLTTIICTQSTRTPTSSTTINTADSSQPIPSSLVSSDSYSTSATNCQVDSTNWRRKVMRSRGESKVKMIVRKGLGGQQDKFRGTIDVRLRLVRSHMAQKDPSISISKLNIHNCISNWVWGTSLEKIAYLSPCGIASSCDFISLALLP